MNTYTTPIKYTIISLLFIIPLILPFVKMDIFFFPFITGKAFIFRFLIEAVFGLWVILAIINPAYRPRLTWVSKSIMFFLVVIGLADIFGLNFYKSFWSNFERMDGYITLLHLGAYFLVVSTVFSTERIWKWFWNSSIVASVLMAFYVILPLTGLIKIEQGGDRLYGTLGNAIYLAVYMLFNIGLTVFYLYRTKGGSVIRALYGIALALQLFTLYLTATRGTVLGLLGGVLLSTILIALFERERKGVRKTAIGILIFMVVGILGFIALKDSSFVQENHVLNRFATISLTEGTVKARFLIWNIAWEGIKERPLLGWGQENFNLVFNKYYDPKMYAQEQWFDRAHNAIFDWLVVGGFIGFLSYVLLFVAVLCALWRSQSSLDFTEKVIFTGLISAYAFHNVFVFDNLISYIFFFSILGYIQSLSSRNMKPYVGKVPTAQLAGALAIVIVVATGFLMYGVNGKAYGTNRALLKALNIMNVDEGIVQSCTEARTEFAQGTTRRVCVKTSPTIDLYRKALSYDSFGIPEVREQILYSFNRIEGLELLPEKKAEIYDLGIREMIAQTQEVPNDARYHLILGGYLANFGQLDAAVKELAIAYSQSPMKQTIIIPYAQVLMGKKENDKALELLKQAYELETSNVQALAAYASALISVGKKEEVQTLLNNGPIIPDYRLVTAYYELKKYDAVIEILTAQIEKMPEEINLRTSLAVAYLEAGKRAEAIGLLEKAIIDIPSFKTQGEYLIKEIKAGRNPNT